MRRLSVQIECAVQVCGSGTKFKYADQVRKFYTQIKYTNFARKRSAKSTHANRAAKSSNQAKQLASIGKSGTQVKYASKHTNQTRKIKETIKGVFTMKIEMWSDYVCPFSYMGKRHLDIALEELNLTEDVDIDFKSYQLNPDIPGYSGESMKELLSKKQDVPQDQVEKNLREVQLKAEKAELYYNFEIMKPTNTLDAHRLTKYATTIGKHRVLAEKIFNSYFEKGGLISDHDKLLELAAESGISKSDANKVLTNPDAYKDEVLKDMARAEELNVESVPYFLIDKEHVIPGSESVETFIMALQQIRKGSSETTKK